MRLPGTDPHVTQFPITAIREIKLLKALSHPNILQLKEMAVERSKGKACSISNLWEQVADDGVRRGTEEAQHVHGHPIHGT